MTTPPVYLPRTPDTAHLSDDYFVNVPFVRYEMVGDTKLARIVAYGVQSLGVIKEEQAAGKLTIALEGNMRTDYLDMTGAAPLVKPRPSWTTQPTPTPLLPKQETVIKGLPACTVSYAGPVTGDVQHPAGDLKIGFTMPGNYILNMEPFPYMPFTVNLVVNPDVVSSVTANASVKL